MYCFPHDSPAEVPRSLPLSPGDSRRPRKGLGAGGYGAVLHFPEIVFKKRFSQREMLLADVEGDLSLPRTLMGWLKSELPISP